MLKRTPLAFALIPVSLLSLVTARLHHSLVPEDPYAFPKYRVTFLNGLPVLNETAQRWLQYGLRGGELEFFDQPWEEEHWRVPPLKSIDGSSEQQDPLTSESVHSSPPGVKLELMKFGPRSSYLCLIPPPPPEEPASPSAEEATEVTPVHTWSLLQPLAGTCLYHRQGWFTYSYCHNSHVRQFHELANPQGQRIGEYKPEEDAEWEAYTLGRAPPTLEPGADLTVAEEAALAANVELARGPGSRYLVQRWGDGTYCDKTGRKREIEIQFHCSMTMTDTILFVKETQTCHYVLHIATPRLCGEPGFRSRLDAREETFIRCREILNAQDYETADQSLPQADHPFKMPKKNKPVIAPPPAAGEGKDGKQSPLATLKERQHDLIRKALERFIAGGELKAGEVIIEPLGEGDEEFVLEFVEADHYTRGDVDTDEDQEEGHAHPRKQPPSLEDILRSAGFDIKGEKKDDKSQSKDSDGDKEQRAKVDTRGQQREEL